MTKAKNIKEKKLIETAKKLFFKHGIKRITIEEICTSADVSKMTFYKFFKNKSDLLIRIMDEIIEESYKTYHDIINKDVPYSQKIREVIEMKLNVQNNYGEAFIEEASKSDSFIYQYLLSKSVDRIKSIEELYNMGISEGAINRDYTLEFFIYMIYKTGEFFNDESIVKFYPDKKERMSAILNLFFYGIMGKS